MGQNPSIVFAPGCSSLLHSTLGMSACPQCHAEFAPEELDSDNPACPVCGESFRTKAGVPDTTETTEHDPLRTAPKIDGFEITSHIGRGGMGDVWEARQNVLGRKVAIKVLAKNLSRSEHFLARFTREAYTLGRLQHPGIVSIYDFRSSPDGMCCIIMEYIEGPKRGEPTTLYDLIVSRELTPDRTRFLILQVLDSLQYAHEEGVIHRDIKPTNVLIDRYGRVKVVDFGIAAMPADPTRKQLTYVGGPLGTAEYMAPEQTEDATKADHRADLYAVGVVIYEMLTGTRPRGAFALPSKVQKNIDPAWDHIVYRALQPNREDRFANAVEMITAVRTIRGTMPAPSDPVLPLGALETNYLIAPIAEVPFDKEPEEFPQGVTPLPVNTPTIGGDADAEVLPRDNQPSDTDLLPEEQGQEVPGWMLKRRDQVENLEETQAHRMEDDAESVLDQPPPGSKDSALRLDKQEETESSDEIPAAGAEDLEDWLKAGPAPGGNDSAHIIEISAQRIQAGEGAEAEAPAGESKEEDSSDVVPLPAEASQRSTATGTSGVLTTDDVNEEAPAAIPPLSQEDLPDGDFVELCYDAWKTPAVRGDQAILFRPAVRPPIIKILVLDDGSGKQGQWFRIRKPNFVIGRKEGDLVIEYDRSISGRHAEIFMEESSDGLFEFVIRDLNTTNGTFARASRATLRDGQEFLLGYRRYKLILNDQDNPKSPPFDKLVEVNKKTKGKSFRLGKPPIIIGRDPTRCNLLILDDPFLSPVHAVMKKDSRNRWVIKNYNSRNGIWIQIDEMKLIGGGEFQIGGQRFIVQLS